MEGFDFSVNFNEQEIMSTKLILCQVIYAIAMQKYNGHFVLKVFDIFTKSSIDIIYILNLLYRNVFIIKPNTSRYANSERYIVCKHFKLSDTTDLVNKFLEVYDKINENNIIQEILNIEIPYFFVSKLEEINSILGQQQIENISNTINLIEYSYSDRIENLKKNNIQKCIQWCNKNNLPHHKNIQQTNIFLSNRENT